LKQILEIYNMCKYGKGNSDFPEVGWPVNSQAIPNRTLACYC